MTRLPRDAEPVEAPLLAKWRGAGCPAPELLLPAIEGTLPEPLARAVSAHVAGCAICNELGAVLRDAADACDARELPAIGRPHPVAAPRHLHRWLSLAAAAAVLLAVAGGAYVATRVASVPLPAVDRPVVVARAAPAPQPLLPLAPPGIELPPEYLTLRGAERGSYAAALERGLVAFQRGDYGVAAARLERVVRANPRRVHAQFYLGAALLMRGHAAEAIRHMEEARALAGPRGSLYPEATWYLAVALERSGRRAEALGPLSELCGVPGALGPQACEGLSDLLDR